MFNHIFIPIYMSFKVFIQILIFPKFSRQLQYINSFKLKNEERDLESTEV